MTAWVPPLLLLCELTLVTSCAAFKTVVIFHQPTFPFTHLPTATSPHRPLAWKGPFQIMAITFPIHNCTHATKLQVRPRSFLHPADKHHLITIGGQIPNWRLFAVKYLLQICPALPVTRRSRPRRTIATTLGRRCQARRLHWRRADPWRVGGWK